MKRYVDGPRSAMYIVSLCAAAGGLCTALICVVLALRAAIGSLTKAACLVFFVPWGCFASWAGWETLTGSFFRSTRPALHSWHDAVGPAIVLGACAVAVIVFCVFLPPRPVLLPPSGQDTGRR